MCSDLTIRVEDTVTIWEDISPLARFKPDAMPGTVEKTADTIRQQLRTVMQKLQAEEAGLRELILVTSASTSETRNLELQTQVLGLTTKLNRLTTWLIILTVVLVILGVAGLVVQVVNAPSATSNRSPSLSTQPSPRTANSRST